MKVYGLIGYPLGHSWSPAYFNNKFKNEGLSAKYQLFPLESINQFPRLIQEQAQLSGLNVTIPYKKAIIPYLDKIDSVAKEIGAVNTIVFKDGKTKGFNTDAFGFEQTLNSLELAKNVEAIIFGTGGASEAIKYVLLKRGIPFKLVSRDEKRGDLTYTKLFPSDIEQHKLLINTTPVGTAPNTFECLNIPYEAITANHLVIDLIYNPTTTLFLQKARAQKAKTSNGLFMLEQQAIKAWQLWQA